MFRRSAGTTGAPAWTQRAELNAADATNNALFGCSVALYGDTALVGSSHGLTSGPVGNGGAAYVFTRSGVSWMQQTKLLAPVPKSQADFGASVALSADMALVGSPGNSHSGKQGPGAADVFTRSGSFWTRQQTLTAADPGTKDFFGGDGVALSGDTALIGVPRHHLTGGVIQGAAYVFLTAPAITSFKPAFGPVGTSVAITGSYLTGATAVAFNGTAADFIAFGIAISTTVPTGAITGPITVTTPLGAATSTTDFVVMTDLKPVIVKLQPASARRGGLVVISGANFGNKWRHGFTVKFGAKVAGISSWGSSEITCKVPPRTGFGALMVTVTTLRGTSNGVSFTVNH